MQNKTTCFYIFIDNNAKQDPNSYSIENQVTLEFFGNSHLTDYSNRQTNERSLKCILCECISKPTLQILHQIEVYDLKFHLMYNSKLHWNVIYIKTSLWCNICKIHDNVYSQKIHLNAH